MIPVFQKVISEKDGDCFGACVASLLNLHDYPNLQSDEKGSQIDKWNAWLSERNLQVITYPLGSFPPPIGFSILSVKSALFEKTSHAVIFQGDGWYGEIVHNPNPKDPRGVKIANEDWLRFTVLALVDPSAQHRLQADGLPRTV